MAKVPFPAPAGKKWIARKSFRHWRSKKIIHAEEYGKECFFFLVKA